MKKIKLLTMIMICFTFFEMYSQVIVNDSIGYNLTPNPKLALEMKSSKRGFLPAELTRAQMNNIASPTSGLMFYDSTLKCVAMYYKGAFNCLFSKPVDATSIPSGVQGVQVNNHFNGWVGSNYSNTFVTATATYTTDGNAITSVTVSNPGFGYKVPPRVVFTGQTNANTSAFAKAILDSNGSVTSIVVLSGGSGYDGTRSITVRLEQNPIYLGGTNAAIGTSVLDGSGGLLSFPITRTGKRYFSPPTCKVGPPPTGGTRATCTFTSDPTTGKLTGYSITNPGSGYLTAPAIFIVDNITKYDAGESFDQNSLCVGKTISRTGCDGATSLVAANATYPIVEINGQCWFAANLKEIPTNFANYTPLSWLNVSKSDEGHWGFRNTTDTSGASGWGTTEPINNGEGTGYLYQISALMNNSTLERSRGACPTGWHVPSDCEFMYLEHGLGDKISTYQIDTGWGTNNSPFMAGKLYKDNVVSSTSGVTGFNLVDSGQRATGGTFHPQAATYLRTSTGTGWSNVHHFFSHSGVTTIGWYSRVIYGDGAAFSVRCLKD